MYVLEYILIKILIFHKEIIIYPPNTNNNISNNKSEFIKIILFYQNRLSILFGIDEGRQPKYKIVLRFKLRYD